MVFATFLQGWKFADLFFERLANFFLKDEWKSDSLAKKSELLPLLFCHEHWATWANCSRRSYEYEFFEWIAHFLRGIRLNPELITHITLF